MATITKPHTFSPNTTASSSEVNSNFDTVFNDYNGNITNANVSASAAIAASKLNLATIAQAITMSGAIIKPGKGADVASAAALTLGDDGNSFDITGTTTITSITAKTAGTIVVLQFDGILTVTDGSNLKLAGNMTTAAESTLTLFSDGVDWYEISRSPISAVATAATQTEQEAGVSITVATTPGRQQYHPSAAKAFCSFNGSGTPAMNGTPYNISTTITDNGTGLYAVTFTTAISSANYCVVGTTNDNNGGGQGCVVAILAQLTTGFSMRISRCSDNAAIDATLINLVVFGDL